VMDKAKRRWRVEAHFATKPDEKMLMGVHDLVRTKYGREYRITVTIVPELIAGFRLMIGDTLVDASLAGRINRWRVALKQPAAEGKV